MSGCTLNVALILLLCAPSPALAPPPSPPPAAPPSSPTGCHNSGPVTEVDGTLAEVEARTAYVLVSTQVPRGSELQCSPWSQTRTRLCIGESWGEFSAWGPAASGSAMEVLEACPEGCALQGSSAADSSPPHGPCAAGNSSPDDPTAFSPPPPASEPPPGLSPGALPTPSSSAGLPPPPPPPTRPPVAPPPVYYRVTAGSVPAPTAGTEPAVGGTAAPTAGPGAGVDTAATADPGSSESQGTGGGGLSGGRRAAVVALVAAFAVAILGLGLYAARSGAGRGALLGPGPAAEQTPRASLFSKPGLLMEDRTDSAMIRFMHRGSDGQSTGVLNPLVMGSPAPSRPAYHLQSDGLPDALMHSHSSGPQGPLNKLGAGVTVAEEGGEAAALHAAASIAPRGGLEVRLAEAEAAELVAHFDQIQGSIAFMTCPEIHDIASKIQQLLWVGAGAAAAEEEGPGGAALGAMVAEVAANAGLLAQTLAGAVGAAQPQPRPATLLAHCVARHHLLTMEDLMNTIRTQLGGIAQVAIVRRQSFVQGDRHASINPQRNEDLLGDLARIRACMRHVDVKDSWQQALRGSTAV